MHEFPQALPVVQVLQHAMGLAGGVPVAGPEEALPVVIAGSYSLPRLAVPVASTNPNTDTQILNADFIVRSGSSTTTTAHAVR
jgi:hypothetical protein